MQAANYYHSGPLPAVEVKMSDLQTPRMTSVIYEVLAHTWILWGRCMVS